MEAVLEKLLEANRLGVPERLATPLWKRQRELAGRGRIKGTRIYQSGDGIDVDKLTALLDSFDLDEVPPILDRIREQFPDASDASTSSMEVISDLPRKREQRPEPDPQVTVYNGSETISYNAHNGQVDVFDNSDKNGIHLAVAGITGFCHLTSIDAPVTDRAGGRLTLERKEEKTSRRLVVDGATGFVYRDSFRYNGGGSGRETWQFAPKRTEQGLVVPALSVEVNVSENRVGVIWIKTVESIDLAAPIAPEDFVVSVPAGTMILDYRDGRDNLYRGVVRGPVTDVLARANEVAATRKLFVPPVEPGDPAPAILATTWVDATGKIDPPKLDGKVVLIDFWGITCGPCVAALPEVRETVEHFRGTDLVVVGLHEAGEAPEKVVDFAARRDLNFPIAIDRPAREEGWFGETFAAFGVRAIPGAAVIDRQGKIVFVGRFPEALEHAAALLK